MSAALVIAEVQALLDSAPVTLDMALDGMTERIMRALNASGSVARSFIRQHLAAMPYGFALPLAEEVPLHMPANQRRSPWVELVWWDAMLSAVAAGHHLEKARGQDHLD